VQHIAERDVAERDVDGTECPARVRVDHGRNADPDGTHVLGRHVLDRLDDGVEEGFLRLDRRRHLMSLVQPAVRIERACRDLRAAEVDADDSLGGHGTRLPYRPGWRTQRSPTGSTRADA
jgi:hypothetical protein